MSITDNLEKIKDPQLRRIFESVANTARIRAEKKEDAANQVPWRGRLSYGKATPKQLPLPLPA